MSSSLIYFCIFCRVNFIISRFSLLCAKHITTADATAPMDGPSMYTRATLRSASIASAGILSDRDPMGQGSSGVATSATLATHGLRQIVHFEDIVFNEFPMHNSAN